MTRRLKVDLNRRYEGLTPAKFGANPPTLGQRVHAYEPEDEVVADATVRRIDRNRLLALLDVDWESMRDDDPSSATTPEEFISASENNKFIVATYHRKVDPISVEATTRPTLNTSGATLLQVSRRLDKP